MSMNGKSSADLEREVSEQRSRVEARVSEIKDRLSPGQLLDEALSYTRHGGAHFASNLGQQISANPLPAALVGVGLAWLIASNANGQTQAAAPATWNSSDDDYPYARISSSSLRRVRHEADEDGQWWSEFETGTGQNFKAKAGELGERASHFTDETGKRFAGFIDDAGNRIRDFQDESGNRLDEAKGWASHTWRDATTYLGRSAQDLGGQVGRAGAGLARGTRDLSGKVMGGAQTQADQLTRQVVDLFNDQPLIGGALVFAAGAALGAVLPHTAQEDALIGEQADMAKAKAAETAGDLYAKGKDQAAKLYADATKTGAEAYEQAKEKIAQAKDKIGQTADNSTPAGYTGLQN